MSDTPLEIKVVYDSRTPGRVAARSSARTLRPTAGARTYASSRPLVVLVAIGSLLASAAAYYITWWRVDPYLYTQLIMKTPVPVNPQKAAALLGLDQPHPEDEPDQGSLPGTAQPESASPALAFTGTKYSARTSQIIIWAGTYGWLALATLAACTLAISSGSAWGRLGGPNVARLGAIILILGVILLALGAWSESQKYGRKYPPEHLRLGLGGLVVTCLSLGATMRLRARGAAKWAAFCLILSATATVVGLYLGGQAGALEPKYYAPKMLGIIFVGVSAWAWMLLIVSRRLR